MEKFKKRIQVCPQPENDDYYIKIGHNLINNLGQIITEVYSGQRILLVSDSNVADIYGKRVRESLTRAGFTIYTYIVPAGEGAKSFKYLQKGYDRLVEHGFTRDNLILALGGGVVGDLAGYLAASYMRGIPCIQVPTTLLAQVDSSVGGKTAINHKAGKNLIGAFYQPDMVIIDIDFLKTLPFRELKTGMAEVIKYGLITDSDFFTYLVNNKNQIYNLQVEALIYIIKRSCTIKSEIVEKDQKERGLRALLNFGHTIGHGLEAITAYNTYNHGEAVAIGMRGAARLSKEKGYLEEGKLKEIEKALDLFQLPAGFREDIDNLLEAMLHDKKAREDKLNWILLSDIGKAFIESDIDLDIIRYTLEGLMCRK